MIEFNCMTATRVTIPCGDISLEGIYGMPEGRTTFAAVVVCHPHPLYGGMMENNVVIAICHALAENSIAYLRFNFRGVGCSQGVHDNGIGERDDVTAALTFISSMTGIDQDRIGLCGYSFGASVALEVAAIDKRVQSLVLVSPLLSSRAMQGYVKPKLLLWGSRDLALPAADLGEFMKGITEPVQYDVIEGADHFWWGFEDSVASRTAAFFTDTINPP
ncbi:MAG: alpha/beta fold hydrolase [Dehalococcoidia bacterium]|nr:MAG: alpha/beta fold hydrolase [Dehalococcoidia bacterium]